MTDDLPFDYPDASPANPAAPKPRCGKHQWDLRSTSEHGTFWYCWRCGRVRDELVSRRGRTARKRGISDELRVAELMGGRKVGPMGWPWDVEVPGYARFQCKKLDRWPSLNEVLTWLDAIPPEPELRGVTLANNPGPGRRTRRLLVVDLDEFAERHGKG